VLGGAGVGLGVAVGVGVGVGVGVAVALVGLGVAASVGVGVTVGTGVGTGVADVSIWRAAKSMVPSRLLLVIVLLNSIQTTKVPGAVIEGTLRTCVCSDVKRVMS